MSERASITKIVVRALFGQLNYDLSLQGQEGDVANRVSILYGDNGSGKTTVLKLLYHLLSPVDDKGHKSFLVVTPFNYFSVSFNTGITVTAFRHNKATTGALTLEIRDINRLLHELPLKIEEDGTVKMNSDPRLAELVAKFLNGLNSLNLEIFFLRDNRVFTSSLDDSSAKIDSGDIQQGAQFDFSFTNEMVEGISKRRQGKGKGQSVEAISKVENFFRELTIRGSSRGEGDVNDIYAAVIKQLIQAQGQKEQAQSNELKAYMDRLAELANKNNSFVELGLSTPLLFKDLSSSLATVKPQFETPILNVLKPYIEGVEARLSALNDTKDTIATFTNALNSYLVNKKVFFHVSTGFRILRSDGEELDPNWLSSGERQLLFLFCRIMGSKPRSSIFIIDEPEISLNVKWQRNLVANLLLCSQREPMQFLFASHSVELLTQFQHRVTALKNIDAPK